MTVKECKFLDFRNMSFVEWQPGDGVNVICGQNAQGKTNLLEGLWLFTGGKSFRGSKDAELVKIGSPRARLQCTFEADGREQTADIQIEKRRKITLNGVALSSPTKMTGLFGAVVFSPDHLMMIKGSPDGRRRFLDAALCQVKPGYIKTYSEYMHIVQQRNALLKDWFRFGDDTILEAWNKRMSAAAAEMVVARRDYVARLRAYATEFYAGLSSHKEKFEIDYEPEKGYESLSKDEIAAYWEETIAAARQADVGAGFSTVGPHREDLSVSVAELSARAFGSQGQQRSAVLALKMAEAAVLGEITGERPAILLDDVMSELDVDRQNYLMNHLAGWQVFITACDPSALGRLSKGRVFRMESGNLSET
ncbi:MAG: DNA replication/repair protein RecF [Clostridia bacterium]|nr:DNA replication/repair protein RecF [Clostridia bacterium]